MHVPNTSGYVDLLEQGKLLNESARFGVGICPVTCSCAPWGWVEWCRCCLGPRGSAIGVLESNHKFPIDDMLGFLNEQSLTGAEELELCALTELDATSTNGASAVSHMVLAPTGTN